MIRHHSDYGFLQKPQPGYDANIPHGLDAQTRRLSAWAGTLQLSAFLALLVLPLILITGTRHAPETAGVLALLWTAVRRSHLHYLRVRVS
ncbi:hypothetical protein [Streptomyces sp. NPDC005302]|uniref:hypothetical protein n=1 Tax=Streptomyces sp. NPDC005302 TaxID=3154675 RepID=UPI0033BF3D33